MMPAELERLYRIRMSLPPAQRAQVEQEYEAYMASKQPQRASPTSLDPVEASAMDIPDDPETTGRAQAGLFANLPEIPVDDADRGTTADAGLAANLPPLEDPGITEEEVDARVRMVQQRGASDMFTPETQRAVARAALEYPVDPTSGDYSTPQFRAAAREAIARENQARAAAKAQAEAEANAPYEEGARQRANIQRLIRAGVNPMQDMTAPTPEQQGQFDNWARSGSVERMARYAPGEYARRQEAAAEGYRQDARQELARRNDPVTGQAYKDAQRDKTARQLRSTDVMANRKLYRELAAMGINPDQFGDPQSSYDRATALKAKTKATYSGSIGTDKDGNSIPVAGRAGAVQRNAQMRQNPVEYLGRPDITDEQRLSTMFYLANGRGPTPNEVKALSAKQLLEGVQMGLRQNLNVNNQDAAGVALADRRARGQAAQQAAVAWYDKNVGSTWRNKWNKTRYNSMVQMLQAPPYTMTPEEAQGIAAQFGPPEEG